MNNKRNKPYFDPIYSEFDLELHDASIVVSDAQRSSDFKQLNTGNFYRHQSEVRYIIRLNEVWWNSCTAPEQHLTCDHCSRIFFTPVYKNIVSTNHLQCLRCIPNSKQLSVIDIEVKKFTKNKQKHIAIVDKQFLKYQCWTMNSKIARNHAQALWSNFRVFYIGSANLEYPEIGSIYLLNKLWRSLEKRKFKQPLSTASVCSQLFGSWNTPGNHFGLQILLKPSNDLWINCYMLFDLQRIFNLRFAVQRPKNLTEASRITNNQ